MDNRIITTNSKRIMAGNIVLLVAIFGCWNEIKWYDFVAPLGTVVSFVALVAVILCYVDINKLIRDKQAYIVLAGCVVAFVNILIVHSGLGAFFTAADVLLSLYLADKIIMPRKMLIWTGLYLAFFFFYWTFDVKGYFKGYNTNYGGLVLITGFVFTVIIITLLRERYVASGNKAASIAMVLLLIYMFAWGYNIISWYRARCAFLGFLVFILILILHSAKCS